MRVLAVQASPRKDGNTATLVKGFLQGLSQSGNHDIREFWLNDMEIKPCQGCFRCAGGARCVIEDDMQRMYPELEAAELIVFGVPIYWWHMNAQMKLFTDRMTALLSEGDKLPALAAKPLVVMVAYNYRDCARAVLQMFEEWRGWIGIALEVIEHCAKEGPVSACSAKMEEAFRLGQRMASSTRLSMP